MNERLLLGLVWVLGACGTENTLIDGRVGSSRLAIGHACFGVTVDVGTHAAQRYENPRYLTAVYLHETRERVSEPPVAVLWFELNTLAAGESFDQSSFMYGPTGDSFDLEVSGTMLEHSVSGLPTGSEVWREPYAIRGRLVASVSISSKPDNLPSSSENKPAAPPQVQLEGQFVAEHCSDRDGVRTE